MSSPGGGHQPYGEPTYGQQADPFSGQPLPPGHGSGGYQQAPPIEQYQGGGWTGGYEGVGYYAGGQPSPPPRRSPLVPLAIGGFLLLVLLGVGVVLVSAGGDDQEREASAPATTSVVSSPQQNSQSSPAPSTASQAGNRVPAVTAGWQGVLSPKENVAYDVPPDWTVEPAGMLTGFEDESGPRTVMHGVSTFAEDACPGTRGSHRGRVGFMSAKTVEPERAARVAPVLWAEAAAELPENSGKVPIPKASRVPIAGGTLSAYQASAVVDLSPGGECPAPRMKVTAVAFTRPGSQDTALFIVYTDLDVPDRMPADVASKIVASLRPAR